jgi:hypothetical protein
VDGFMGLFAAPTAMLVTMVTMVTMFPTPRGKSKKITRTKYS